MTARGEPLSIGSAMAHRQLGEALAENGMVAAAITELRTAVAALHPAAVALDHDRELESRVERCCRAPARAGRY